jgi:5-methylcytosine-specific restriction protein A
MRETQSPRERHPVLRTGERGPIDPYKRRLIYERDGYACQHCGASVEPDSQRPGLLLQLDHVVPWSANGSDRSDNLRSLCGLCNEDRSNFVDDIPPRLIGVARSCYWCARQSGALPDHLLDVDPGDLEKIHAYCGRCGSTSWVPSESWIL